MLIFAYTASIELGIKDMLHNLKLKSYENSLLSTKFVSFEPFQDHFKYFTQIFFL